MPRTVVALTTFTAALFGPVAHARPDVAPPPAIIDRVAPPAPAHSDAGLTLDDAIDRVLPPESAVPVAAPDSGDPPPIAVSKYASAYARLLEGNLAGARLDALESLKYKVTAIEPLVLLGRIERRLGRPLSARHPSFGRRRRRRRGAR